MGIMVREKQAEAKLGERLSLEALGGVLSPELISSAVAQTGSQRKRRRKVAAELVVLLAIAMNLFAHESLEQVLERLTLSLRLFWPQEPRPPTKSAMCQARYRVGARALVSLFRHFCWPLAAPQCPGAFLYGLRLMAIDASVEDVADTPANERYFGRSRGQRGVSAFPQLRALYLLECGTHAIVDAGIWPCRTSERLGARRLLRSLEPGMLLMWDRGLHSYQMVAATLARGAQLLARLPGKVTIKRRRPLSDGSWLIELLPPRHLQARALAPLRLRLIEYCLEAQPLPKGQERHRLITSLLDEKHCPARELVCAYHERWEIELAIDECSSHQRLAGRPLRSRKPVGVVQEFYGLLIAHYLVRRLMYEAAMLKGIDPDRVSFSTSLCLIGQVLPFLQISASACRAALLEWLLREIGRHCLPKRRQRLNPRVVKRKMSNFPLKRPQHAHCPQPAASFVDTIVILN